MECRQFREYVVDNPRPRTHENVSIGSPFAHANKCEACAAWLAAEENLAEGFELVRQQDGRLKAPADLEAALVEEFRHLRPPKPRTVPVRHLRRIWWVAAAAALALGAWFSLGKQQPPDSPETATALVGPDVGKKPDALPRHPDSTVEAPATALVTTEPATPRAASSEPAPPHAIAQQVVPPSIESPAPAEAARDAEVVTEFVPLIYTGSATPVPGARLVRVRLPSTALAYFGLPGAAASSSVDADVLLGDDGLAYAVRFVRPAKVSFAASNRGDPGTPDPY